MIAPAELARLTQSSTPHALLDLREKAAYERGHIYRATSLPRRLLEFRLPTLVPVRATPLVVCDEDGRLAALALPTIVVHCGGRTRSYIGAESLRRMQLPNPVLALENGTMGWELAGLTLERGAARWAPAPSARSRAVATLTAKRVAAEDGLAFISPDDLAMRLARRERNLYVLDVRTADEYAASHVAGAVWAPGGQAVQATDEYVAVRAASIVLVCDGFARSVMTASWLRRMGFPDVAVLAGGLPAWTAAGGAVERKHPTVVPFGWEAARQRVARVAPGDLGTGLILSVDQSDAYARGHVPGARWLCRSRLEWTIGTLAPERQAPIVVTCADGVASTLAAATLDRLGYTAVSVLEGGTRAWADAGLAVEDGRTRLADEPDDVVLKPYERGREAMERYLRWEADLDQDGRSRSRLL